MKLIMIRILRQMHINFLEIVVQPFDRRCRVLPNDTVSCDRVLYQDPVEWKNHKEKLDEMIEEYRKMLEDLRVKDVSLLLYTGKY